MKRLLTLLFTLHCSLFTLFTLFTLHAQYVPDPDTAVQRKLEQWQDMKFGLLMHWGPYSQWGVVESWSICAEDEGWCSRKTENYVEYKTDYEKLPTTFNPVNFDPARWAKAAKYAGMKYVVFTTKHHDGFCMFDTKQTNYKITDPSCPFSKTARANVTKNIFDAFRAEGMWVGPYFSKPDWHNENYWWPNFATPDRNVNYDIKKYPERWGKFIDYTHKQVMELMSDYGKLDILWLDGGWVRPLSDDDITRKINEPGYNFTHYQSQDINMDGLVQEARAKQPGLIVVDRAVPGKNQNYLTPENEVPQTLLPYPWESCIISGGGWSWVPDAKYKSAKQVVQMLVDIVSKGGNMLLNVAPGPDGSWDAGAYQLLEQIGNWMNINGEAIYNTRPLAPYRDGKMCFTQSRMGSLYAIYLPDDNEKALPPRIWISSLVVPDNASVSLLGSTTPLKWEQMGKGILVEIPESLQTKPPCENAWVVKVTKVGY